MKIKLTPVERILIIGTNLLPVESTTRLGLQLNKEIKELLELKSEELERIGYKELEKGFFIETNEESEFEFSEVQKAHIKKQLDRLDSENLFHEALIPLDIKFQ